MPILKMSSGIGSPRLSIQPLLDDMAVEVASLNLAGRWKYHATHNQRIKSLEYVVGIILSIALILVSAKKTTASLQS